MRNLEFLFGDMEAKGLTVASTVAPLGSNFVAALAGQAARVGVSVTVNHFVPAASAQMRAHYQFSKHLGANLQVAPARSRYLSAMGSAVSARWQHHLNPLSYWIAPGGSSPVGALGHVSAMLELAQQVRRGEVPLPDLIVVGAGTCGTLAGLLVGCQIAGLNVQIVGVRCVDRIVCNRWNVKQLADRVLRSLGRSDRLSLSCIHLRPSPYHHHRYGDPSPTVPSLRSFLRQEEDIVIDDTYTGNVWAWLHDKLRKGHLSGRRVLYWHTYSPAAWQGA